MFLKDSPLQWWLSAGQQKLPAEVECGNVEYKWRLMGNVDEERRMHLVTQMRWRVAEAGHCWYILGVKDNGSLDGVSESEMGETLTVISDLVRRAQLSITAQQLLQLPDSGRFIGQVRIEPNLQLSVAGAPRRDLKVALLGDSGCGKTTLLSVLTDESGNLDDGRGGMRARLLHHRHELLSGSTSSITQRSLVFSQKGNNHACINIPADSSLLQPELKRQVLTESKVVHLIDSAGKLRFDRSMLAVLTCLRRVDGVCLVVEAPPAVLNANYPACTLSVQSRELLTLIRGLKIPLLAIIVSKIDYSSTESLGVLLEELAEAVGKGTQLKLFTGGEEDSAGCPVLLCSAVTGDYLDALRTFFSRLPQPEAVVDYELLAETGSVQCAFVVEGVTQVPQIGTVVWGQVASGVLRCNTQLHCLPGKIPCTASSPSNDPINAAFQVTSIERLKIPVKEAHPGQYVSLALKSSPPLQRGHLLCQLAPNQSIPSFRPLRKIIAELTVAPVVDSCSVNGLLFVAGRRFGAQLDLESRVLRRLKGSVCLVTIRGGEGGEVFLQPGAGFVFAETGRVGSRERFIGHVIDYFA